MAVKPETHIVNDIQEWVINYGGKVLKTHGDAMSEIGTPDLIGSIVVLSVKGQLVHIPFVVEVKLPGENATMIQELQLSRWNKAGMHTAIVTSLHDFVVFMDKAAKYISKRPKPKFDKRVVYYKAKP